VRKKLVAIEFRDTSSGQWKTYKSITLIVHTGLNPVLAN